MPTSKDLIDHLERNDPAGYASASMLAYIGMGLADIAEGGDPRRIGLAVGAAPGPWDNSVVLKQVIARYGRSHGVTLKIDPDPRYRTPDATWKAFIASLRRGDRAGALDCYTPSMRSQLSGLFNAMGNAELKKMADSFVGFELTQTKDKHFQEALVVRKREPTNRAGFASFLNDRGEWKIDQM